jgi:hypothetical protein
MDELTRVDVAPGFLVTAAKRALEFERPGVAKNTHINTNQQHCEIAYSPSRRTDY